MSRKKTSAADPIREMQTMLKTLANASRFVEGMLESYEDGEIREAQEDAKNFKDSYLEILLSEQEMLVKSLKGSRRGSESLPEIAKLAREIKQIKASLK